MLWEQLFKDSALPLKMLMAKKDGVAKIVDESIAYLICDAIDSILEHEGADPNSRFASTEARLSRYLKLKHVVSDRWCEHVESRAAHATLLLLPAVSAAGALT